MQNIKIIDLGSKNYKDSWDFQEELFKKNIDIKINNKRNNSDIPTSNYLLFVEHPPVYTLGKSGNLNHLLLNELQLKQKNIDFFKTNRGGDITFHGPGQLVSYPILDLENFFSDINKYIRTLEEIIIKTLAEFGIESTRSEGETGVWLDVGTPLARKICAIGVRTSRWVTMHGFALNINTDLGYFDNIIPCGIKGKSVTSMKAELGKEIPLNEVQQVVIKHFTELFKVKVLQ